uniref:PIH1D1/2/3 CS-like domain-containing protein n=2 Tax=Hemiselmis andersenii TaxID=464988 RepID=A0A6T8M176_HEMAN
MAEMDGIFTGELMDDGEIREVSTRKSDGKKKEVVKKGFLQNTEGRLYENDDGSHGSNEQSGPKYDPVEAQLAHLPEGLRKKCAVVDTTKMSKEESRDAMEQYANTGRVTSGPAAPGGPARQPSEKETKDFEDMLKKAQIKSAEEHAAKQKSAYNDADEPSFALKLGGKKGSKLTELEHECSEVTHPKLGGEAYSLSVSMPEEVEDMSMVDVEVSALKVEVEVTGTKLALNLAWPKEVDADAAKAKFSKKKRTLTILAPLK